MLKTRYISAGSTLPTSWKNLKIGGTSHERQSNTASTPFGSMRGTLSTSPPPVMCAMPWIFTPALRTARTGFRNEPWTARRASWKVVLVPGTKSESFFFATSKTSLRASE